jgi:hypothetical protein
MSAPESTDRHIGTFATGQDDPVAHPEGTDVGTFATGQDDPETNPEDTNIGSFADNDELFEKVS